MPTFSDQLLAALPRLRRYARILSGDTVVADQLVEETVRRARDMAFDPDIAPTMRLFALLRRVYIEDARKAHTHGFSATRSRESHWTGRTRETNATSAPSATEPIRHAQGDDVLARLYRLPVEQREVLVLVGVEGLTYQQVAAVLAVPVATVFARLVDARAALHEMSAERAAGPGRAGS